MSSRGDSEPVRHLRWSVLQKSKNFAVKLFSQNAPSLMFDRGLNRDINNP